MVRMEVCALPGLFINGRALSSLPRFASIGGGAPRPELQCTLGVGSRVGEHATRNENRDGDNDDIGDLAAAFGNSMHSETSLKLNRTSRVLVKF